MSRPPANLLETTIDVLSGCLDEVRDARETGDHFLAVALVATGVLMIIATGTIAVSIAALAWIILTTGTTLTLTIWAASLLTLYTITRLIWRLTTPRKDP